MSNQATSWVNFWNDQTVMDDNSWGKNTELLYEGSRSFFPFNPEDTVLDIGSGPGFLADKVSKNVKSIHCLDTSETYVSSAMKRLSAKTNVSFNQLGEDYLDFGILKGKKFSKILCASVIQYYRDLDEVEKLILEVQKLAEPGAKFLIADISIEHNPLKDIIGLVTTAWSKNYLLKIVSFIFKSFGGDYSRVRKEIGLLTINKSEFDQIVKKNNLNAEWRNDILTLNKSRRHLLIHF